jgi:signal transduction histidine kinase
MTARMEPRPPNLENPHQSARGAQASPAGVWTAGAQFRSSSIFRPQRALIIGFALVFALWLAWGVHLVRSLREMERNNDVVQNAYIEGDETLSRVRTNVLLGSIYLRDALIESDAQRREAYRTDLNRLRSEVEVALQAYVPEVTSAAERTHWARLQSELAEFWQSRDLALPITHDGQMEAANLLRLRVVPRRDTILQVLDQLGALQETGNRRRRAEAYDLNRDVRTRLLSMGGATLSVAFLVAVMASLYVAKLQRQIEEQHKSDQANREDLERLSARLVDAQEAERRHLARELHDEVGQALTAMKMDIGIALRSDNPFRVKSALEDASQLAETTLRGVRDLSQLLHPSTLDDFGLPATLAAYLRNFSARTGIRAQLAETIDDRLAPAVETAVYRIVQEALSNVAQHSGATACTVSLNEGANVLNLAIEDNGAGLEQTFDAARRGLGLIGMRERAQALGGTFSAVTRSGGGTQLAVTLPVTRAHIHPSPATAERAEHEERVANTPR